MGGLAKNSFARMSLCKDALNSALEPGLLTEGCGMSSALSGLSE